MRPTCGGTNTCRPESAAAETPMIAPESQPAGSPASPSAAAPTLANAIVSAKRRNSCGWEGEADIGEKSMPPAAPRVK